MRMEVIPDHPHRFLKADTPDAPQPHWEADQGTHNAGSRCWTPGHQSSPGLMATVSADTAWHNVRSRRRRDDSEVVLLGSPQLRGSLKVPWRIDRQLLSVYGFPDRETLYICDD